MAIWEELQNYRDFEVMVQSQQFNIKELDKKLQLQIVPDASDGYTLWFKNDCTYMTQSNGLTTIITSENFDKIKAIMNS